MRLPTSAMRTVFDVAVTSCALIGLVLLPPRLVARQTSDTAIAGQVTLPGGLQGIPDVQVTMFGPMEGQAKAAIASFPLMAAEISEKLSIPHQDVTTGPDGRFQFRNLVPGLYSVMARRPGYVGPPVPDTPATSVLVTATVTVAAGKPSDVLMFMVPGPERPRPGTGTAN